MVMTTPDIAGLCKRLRDNWDWPSLLMTEAADTLERQAAEIERLRGVLADALPYVVQFEDMRDGIHGAPEPNCAMQLAHEIRADLTGEDTATLGLSGKTQTDARTRGDA